MYYTLKEEKSRLIKEQEAGLHSLRVLQEDLEQLKRVGNEIIPQDNGLID